MVLAGGLIAGCSNDTEQAKSPPPPPKPKPLTLRVHALNHKVTMHTTLVVEGRVTPGARVTVGKKGARVRGGRFRARVRLKLGANRINVTALKTGYVTERKRLRIKRKRPPPPVAATPTPPPPQQQSGSEGCPPGLVRQGTQACVQAGGNPAGCGGDRYSTPTKSGGCIGPAHPPTPPAQPGDCPPGQVPVGQTGACAPPE